jgi:hypothetical protein
MSPKKIQIVSSTVQRIPITPSTVERLEPDEVAKALGAEPCPEKLPGPSGPVTRYALCLELFRRLQARGVCPNAEGNDLRATIPLSDQEWRQLEELARQIASESGLSPSPGQVGSVLLSLALRSVKAEPAENGPSTATSALVNELAARGTS